MWLVEFSGKSSGPRVFSSWKVLKLLSISLLVIGLFKFSIFLELVLVFSGFLFVSLFVWFF